MKKNVAKLMAIRFAIYGVLVAYLACDLFVFQGPIYGSLNRSQKDEKTLIAEAKAEGVVARVYSRPIYRAQVEEALREYLWRRGRSVDETNAVERKLLRRIIVSQLIDDELAKLQVTVSTSEEVAVDEARIDKAMAAEKRRFPDEAVFGELAERAGWAGRDEQRMRLAARMQRGDHLQRMIDDALLMEIDEEDAKEWFAEHASAFPGSFEEHSAEILEALRTQRKKEAWKEFRTVKLHRYAEGKVDLYEDVLFQEEGE